MDLFKSGNPALTEKLFQKSIAIDQLDTMTVRGTMNKFAFLFLMVMATAIFTWKTYYDGKDVSVYMWGGAIGGLIIALIIVFKQQWAPWLAPVYGLCQGLFVGAISAYYNEAFAEIAPSIIMQAVGLTFGTIIAMYFLYQARIIKATQRFKTIVIMATLGIAIFYLIAFLLRLANVQIAFIHEGSTIGIIFSLAIVALAALNLILDFDMIENGATMGAPKYMEWYGAFGLLVTIVWLYLEILRLLGKLNSRK
jgi:uncharacterized YccA/Bax inhibitor family protein